MKATCSLLIVGCFSVLILAAQTPPLPPAYSEPVLAYASVNVAWDPSPDSNAVAAYRIHYGPGSSNYTAYVQVPAPQLTATISNLQPGAVYYLAASAVGTNQLESGFSNEINYSVPATNAPPAPPASLGIQEIPTMRVWIEGQTTNGWEPVGYWQFVIKSQKSYGLFRTRLAMSNQPSIQW